MKQNISLIERKYIKEKNPLAVDECNLRIQSTFFCHKLLQRLKKAIYLYSILNPTTYETNSRKWFYKN